MPGLTKNDWKGLWFILWRVVIFCPILWMLGSVWLLLVIAAYIGLPAYATAAIVAGDWFMTATALVAWIIALRFGRPLLRWTFEGIEYGSI